MQEAPADEGEIFSAPLEDQESGRLVVACGIARLTVGANESRAELYQAHFEGPSPNVKAKEGVITIRYPRRLLGLGKKQGAAEVMLNGAIPWRIVIQGGAAEVAVGGLDLAGLEIMGGFSTVRLDLLAPSSVVPIRISGGAAEIAVRRPAGVAVRVKLKGWVSQLVFDEQTFTEVGKVDNNLPLQSPGFDPAAPYYDIEVRGYTNTLTITSG